MPALPPFLAPEKTRFLPVPDEHRDALFPARLCLFEWHDYWFEWRGATHLQVGEKRVEPFAAGLFRVRFENALGASSLQPFRGDTAMDEPLCVEVLSPKFPTPRAHLDFFGALLRDLFERAAPLPFDLAGETARGVAVPDKPPTPLWTRQFLSGHGQELERALRHFAREAAPQWESELCWLDAARATRFDGAAWRETARAGAVWTRHGGAPQPARVAQNRGRERWDTPENRFAVALARRLMRALDALETPERGAFALSRRDEKVRAAAHTIVGARAARGESFAALRGACAVLDARFPRWQEAAPGAALERRAAVRELVRLERLWRGAGAPFFGRFERAARLRDIAQMWEFWVFFALCERIACALQQTPRFGVAASETRGLEPLSRAVFRGGTLVFNGPAPSYSTPLRPDFLWLENGAATLAFDAKFRLEARDDGLMSARGADLHKMHAYRDALGARAAAAIYPGERSVFFERGGAGQSEFSLPALLTGCAQGVGFWALRPALRANETEEDAPF